MEKIFSYNNKFFQVIEKILRCMFLGLLWSIFCIPFVTIGSATTALSYAAEKGLTHDEKIWASFWKAFKRDFKQATTLWVCLIFFYTLTFLDWFVLYYLDSNSGTLKVLFYIMLTIALMVKVWSNYWFPYIAHFSDTTVDVLQKTSYMALMNIQYSLLLLLIDAAVLIVAVVAFFCLPIFLPVLPAGGMWVKNAVLQRVFVKYAVKTDTGEQ